MLDTMKLIKVRCHGFYPQVYQPTQWESKAYTHGKGDSQYETEMIKAK